jgi:hypothetical protein
MASLGPSVGVVDEVAHGGEVGIVEAGQLLLGQSETHGERHQLGLGAVVEVSLDPPQDRHRRVDRLGPRVFKRAHAGGHRARAEQPA